eukprot:Protomagalhaensia_wolfi_Nauph_80__1277@NODE_1757_length_1357_cov_2152_504552_g1337_i1_p1_GENE_NODE_1757_length_1357_cov_2152_504552_g1337_i1NODE_1757_length_1357_cov_2152_504552_g1337_i1_p1_ORF_typecomplete_len318_score47_65RDD/PF06271_12/3_8e03RDD/PF06271_12/0_14_NODE_1757_length_1357_cov_2152_504552_g1337_i12031156
MTRIIVCSSKKTEPEAKQYGLAAALVFTANGGGSDALLPAGFASPPWVRDCDRINWNNEGFSLCEILNYMVNLGHEEAAEALEEAYWGNFKTVFHEPPCEAPNIRSPHAIDFVQRLINLFLSHSAKETAAITGSDTAATPLKLYQTISNSTEAKTFREVLNTAVENRDRPLITESAKSFADYVFKAIVAAGGFIAFQADELARALLVVEINGEPEFNVGNTTCLTSSPQYPQRALQSDNAYSVDPFSPAVLATAAFAAVALTALGATLGKWFRRPAVHRTYTLEDVPLLDEEPVEPSSVWKRIKRLDTDSPKPYEWG